MEHTLRDLTAESDKLKIQMNAMQRQVTDLKSQADRAVAERDNIIKEREGK